MEQKKFELNRILDLDQYRQQISLTPIDGNAAELSRAEVDEINDLLKDKFDFREKAEGDITLNSGRRFHYAFDGSDVLSKIAVCRWEDETDWVIDNGDQSSGNMPAAKPFKYSFHRYWSYVHADRFDLIPVDGKEADISVDDVEPITDETDWPAKGKITWNGREYYYRYWIERYYGFAQGDWVDSTDESPDSHFVDFNDIER